MGSNTPIAGGVARAAGAPNSVRRPTRVALTTPPGDGGLGGARRGGDARCRGGVTDDGRGEK
jgi:hypothetical protein